MRIAPLIYVKLADKLMLQLSLKGIMLVDLPKRADQEPGTNNVSTIELKDVYWHPKMGFTLILQALLCKDGYKFVYEAQKCQIWYPDGSVCGEILTHNNLYIIVSHHKINEKDYERLIQSLPENVRQHMKTMLNKEGKKTLLVLKDITLHELH